MKKRALSFLLVLAMIMSMLPSPAIALTLGSGTAEDPYQAGSTVTNDGSAEPEGLTVENTHWVKTEEVAAAENRVCQLDEHDHVAAACEAAYENVECLLEGHPAEGELTTFTHEDGTVCTYNAESAKWMTSVASGYTCGIEAHTHTTEAGCFEVTPAYTVWTLTADPTEESEAEQASDPTEVTDPEQESEPAERVCLEGCILESEEEHLENGGECLVWIACTLTEGCELADGHVGDCTSASVFAPATITVEISSGRNSSTVKNAYIVVGTKDNIRNDTLYKTNSSGVICDLQGNPVDFDAGEYYIWYGTKGGRADRAFYNATVEVGASSPVTVTLGTASNSKAGDASKITEDQWNWATCVYYNTDICDHIHIRVAGSYTIDIGGNTYTATVSNPEMTVYVNGSLNTTKAWSGTTNYEWTYETSISLSNEIEVHLKMDLTYRDDTGSHTIEDVDIVYNNMTDRDRWIEFIAICDGIQGFDFTVSIQDIQEVIQYYTVTYEWRVYNADGTYTELPAGAPSEPGPYSGIASGTQYVYDTLYYKGVSFTDYSSGLLYTFHGWDTYSHYNIYDVDPSNVGYTALDDDDADASNNKTIEITADTYIYGYWTVTQMPPASAYITIEKKFEAAEDAEAAIDQAKDLYFVIDPGMDLDEDGVSRVDVDYPMIENSGGAYKLNVYQYNQPFKFTEMQADVPGYNRETTITVNGTYAKGDATSGDTVNVTLSPTYQGENVHLGTVTYTNKYTKITGTAVSEYPSLYLLKSASDGGFQDGVVFTLYSDADCTASVGTYTTANGGQLEIDFSGKAAGTYYLKETTPLAGYVADPYVYAITLTAGAPVEELRNGEYVQVTYYTLSVTVPEGSTAVYRETKTTGYYSLHIYNEPILGSLKVSKTTQGGLSEEDKNDLNAVVIVHGPISRDSDGTITSIGSTWTLNLNSENGWIDEIANLPVGEYLIHESFASVHGYTWTGVTYGTLETVQYNGITSGLFKISDDSTHDHSIELTLTNYYEEWASADFYIKKVGPNGEALSGATFEIFVDAAGKHNAMPDDISGENATLSATTGADGYAHFSGYTVPDTAGTDGTVTFYLKETKAPAGYYLDSTVYKVEIKAVTADGKTTFEPKITLADGTEVNFNNTTDLLTVTNSPVLGTLTITKAFPNGIPKDADGNALLTSVKVLVSGPNGYTKTVELNADKTDDKDPWTATLGNLALGTYTITEQDASAPGYDWEVAYSSRTVTLTEETPGYTVTTDVISGSASITNTYTKREETYETPATLKVMKVGEDGTTALAGAVFKLDRMSADGKTVVDSKSYTTNAEGIVVFDLLSGWIVNNDDVDGIYILSETKAPDGYQRETSTWTVTIQDDDGNLRVTLNSDKNIFENFWDWIVGDITGNKQELYTFDSTNNMLTVKNIELADLTVTKSFMSDNNESITPPEGAVIEVAVFDSSNNNLVRQLALSADNNWTAEVENIPAGIYTIRENSPSLHGYTWKGATFTVTGAEYTASGSSVTVTVAESADVKVDIKNTYTTWEAVDFYVMKTKADGTTPLAGATFTLYDANNKDVTNTYLHIGATIHTNNGSTTGSGGILHFHDFKVDNGQTATFTLKETSAPANYYANGNVYYITISHDNDSYDLKITDQDGNELTVADDKAVFNSANDVLTVVNDEILADIVIEKTFPDSALTHVPVKVDVTGPNGYSNTVTLDNSNGFKVTLSGLSLGEYTIKEQEAAKAGYSLTVKYNGEMKESHTVTLTQADDNDAVNVSITNTYVADIHNPASFQIKKVDSVTKEVITTGATFTLYSDEACTVPVRVQTTNENGIATFDGFDKAATYYLKETTAPDGYETVGTVWKVEIVLKNGQPTIQVDETTGIWGNIYDWIVGSINPDSQWANGVLTVENVKKTGKLEIKKTVVDPQNRNADAVYSFTLTLSDRNEPVTFTLKENDSKEITGIPWGTTYTLTENTTGAAYTSIIDHPTGTICADNTEITVTNTYKYQNHNKGLNLVKVDADDTSKVIAGAGFTLYSDEDCKTKVGDEVISDSQGQLHFDITTAGTYYLKETTTPTGYHSNDTVYVVTAEQAYVVLNAGTADAITEIQMHITIAGLTGTTSNQIDYTYSIKNTAIKTVVVTVEKVWDDGSYHARPESVEVTLYRDNKAYATVTLNEDNSWRHTWDDLTDEYSWSVDEVNVPDEYTKTVTNSGNNWTITNARTPKPVEITVTKAWNHNGGKKNLPESISVTLYKDGSVYQTVELSEENDWTYTWSNLTDVSVWSIDETQVPTGYEKKIEVDGYKFKITNTRIINSVEVSVNKVWIASEGVEHPDSVEVVLYRDGKKHDTVKLNEKNGWKHTWTGLTDEYTWTVDEKEVPTGYTKNVEMTETVTEGKYSYDYTITNTKDFKYIDVSVKKIWNGSGVTHPTSVKVTLYRNGVAYDTVALSASNNWKYTWEDLTDEFEWEVDEPSVPSGYNKTVRVYNTYDYYISNTHEDNPKTGDFTDFLGLGALGMVGVVGFVYTAFLLFVPRKKGKYER